MMTKHKKGFLRITVTVTLLLLSSTVGILLAEVGYRIYLNYTHPHQFSPIWRMDDHPSFLYIQKSPYKYSEKFGYEYIPGVFNGGYIHDGVVIKCDDPLFVINERGNSGRIKGSYEGSELKIVVFGDSWTSQPQKERTWPNFLQDKLEEQIGKSVHVVNFGRDGYGILQMFDLAADKVPQWRPDFFIIAFITDDLHRDRFWRMKTLIDGRARLMTSATPNPNPPLHKASDLYVINEKATSEWCHQLLTSQKKEDPIIRDMEEIAIEAKKRSDMLSNPFSLSQSFVWDHIAHGQPFYSTFKLAKQTQWPHHQMKNFGEDERMISNIQILNATGIPYVLVHLAIYPELKTGNEYTRILDFDRDLALVKSLRNLTGLPVYETLDHLRRPIEDLENLSETYPDDLHPSQEGARFYAEIVAEILRRHGYVD